MADPFTVTVCGTCGGSGTVTVVYNSWGDNRDFEVEEEECDNCGGSGWEPPNGEEAVSDAKFGCEESRTNTPSRQATGRLARGTPAR